jgi:hypothetical protein
LLIYPNSSHSITDSYFFSHVLSRYLIASPLGSMETSNTKLEHKSPRQNMS